MADRSIKVTLRANVADFTQQIKQASKSLEEVAKASDKTGKVADTSLGRMGQRATLMSSQMTTAGTAVATFGAGLLAISGMAVKTAAQFDQSMSIVQADTHETASNMGLLREAAIQAGADTAFSATEAAAGIDELAKAGVSTSDILGGGLSGALDLAAAGGVSVADASATAATAMTQFGLSGSDVTHVADLLAAGAGKAQGGVDDLSMALAQGGLVASQMGLSIEETVGGLSAFASAGLLGSDAGTSFKTMLQRLANPSKEAASTMESLGINAYDAQGNFVGLANFAGQLKDKMSGLSAEQRNAAMSTIFGSDAIRAANVLYDQGQAGIQGWIDKVNDAGYAAETAATRQDNLRGDLEKLGGSFETLMIGMGEGAQGPLRTVVQTVTSVVDAFSSLPDPVQQTLTAMAGVGGVALTAVGGMMVLIPRIVETKRAMDELNISAASLSSGMRNALTSTSRLAGLGRSLGMVGLIAGITAAAGGTDKFRESADSAAISLQQLEITGESAGSAFQSLDMANVTADDFTDTLHDIAGGMSAAEKGAVMFASSMDSVAGVVGADTRTDFQKTKDELESMGQALASMDTSQATDAFKQLGDMTDGSEKALSNLLTAMPAYKEHLKALATEAGLAADDATLLKIATGELDVSATGAGDAASSAAGDVGDLGDSAGDAAKQLSDLVDNLSEMYGLVLSQRDAQRGLEQAIDDASDALMQNGQTLDETTQAGRDNAAALDGIASSTWDLVDALKANGASAEDMQAAMQSGRDAYIAAGEAAGLSADQAAALADQLGLIPSNVQVAVEADTEAASTAVDDFVVSVDGMTGSLSIDGQSFPAESSLEGILLTIDESHGTVTINGQTMPASDALRTYLGVVDNSDGTVSINGDPSGGHYQLSQLQLSVNQTTGQIGIGAKDNATGTVKSIVAGFPSSHTITVTTNLVENHTVNTFWNQAPVQRLIKGHATGGPIIGPGTGTSDSILARLSNGEHVLTATEVNALGGQAGVLRLRAMVRAGLLHDLVPGFADGGSPVVHAQVPNVVVNTAAAGASLDASALRHALNGARLSLDAGGVQLDGYVRSVATEQIITDRKING